MPDINNKNETFSLQSFIGWVQVWLEGDCVVRLQYRTTQPANAASDTRLSPEARHIRQQLQTYFANPARRGAMPGIKVKFTVGTAYQQSVWRALLCIKAGQTLSYGALATKLQTGPRAVANACRHNPIPVIVPCHRVIAQSGLGGYHGTTSGRYMDIKKKLLTHEGALV